MNNVTCCPAYTIRCDTTSFKPSKSHRKTLSVVADFLNTGAIPEKLDKNVSQTSVPSVVGAPCKNPWIVNNVNRATKSSTNGQPAHGRSGSSKRARWRSLQERMGNRAAAEGVPYEKILQVSLFCCAYFTGLQNYMVRREKRLAKNKPKELEDLLALEKPKGEAKHFLDVG